MSFTNWLTPMSFSNKLTYLRKKRGLTQYAMCDLTGINLSQIRRWESGTAQPVLEGLIKLAKALHVSLDELVFEDNDRLPSSRKLRLMFEAVEQLKQKDQDTIQELLEMMILKYESYKFSNIQEHKKIAS